MPRRKKITFPTVTVIPDCRDFRKDFIIPLSVAKDMFARFQLGEDLTNNGYFPLSHKALLEAKHHAL